MRIAKCIENRFSKGFLAVSYAVQALRSVTYNLVGKLSGAKSHSGVCLQHNALHGLLQSVCHRSLRMRTALLSVATHASLRTYEAFPWQFLSRAKPRKAACVV